ncbi:MAG: hypothetical protein M1829_001524 [Trizodia sp. TS-e1964]|nr:MAG: hypothetical protein M1829_001524 [Trizodia sp. TS-e1964]
MRLLTKEEEEAHSSSTMRGGIAGGLLGLGIGGIAVWGASIRYPAFRSLTLPLKTFLITSSGTFGAIVQADRSSRGFEFARNPSYSYQDNASRSLDELDRSKSSFDRALDWGQQNRYSIIGASWVVSMATALGLVRRNLYLTRTQKLVQARVYAQGLTVLVLVATAAFEIGDRNKGKGRWETVKIVDPNDPEHQHLIEKKIHHEQYKGEDMWRDMVETEEQRLRQRDSDNLLGLEEKEVRNHSKVPQNTRKHLQKKSVDKEE